MKLWIGIAACLAPLAVLAQDQDRQDLEREMKKKLSELEERFNKERARIKEEFERAMKNPHHEERGGLDGLMDRLERRLGDLDHRLGELERRLKDEAEPQAENAKKFFRYHFDWNDKDFEKWMEQGRRFWEQRMERGPGERRPWERFLDGPEAREALRKAKDILEKLLEGRHGEGRDRLRDVIEELKRIIEEKRHDEDREPPRHSKEHFY
jgi:hypothetical protein